MFIRELVRERRSHSPSLRLVPVVSLSRAHPDEGGSQTTEVGKHNWVASTRGIAVAPDRHVHSLCAHRTIARLGPGRLATPFNRRERDARRSTFDTKTDDRRRPVGPLEFECRQRRCGLATNGQMNEQRTLQNRPYMQCKPSQGVGEPLGEMEV